MDRPSPSDPSDEPVNRLAGFFGKADLLAPKPSLSSQPIEVLSAIELDWSLQAWNSLVELYRHEHTRQRPHADGVPVNEGEGMMEPVRHGKGYAE